MTFILRSSLACLLPVLSLTGCGGGSGSGSSSTAASGSIQTVSASTTSSSAAVAASSALSISGEPAASVTANAAYQFKPTASGGVAKTTFAITNKPAWAAFDAATGALSGTPAAAQEGLYPKIAISVSDGTRTAALAPFSIKVLAPAAPVTLSWTQPAKNTNGTVATDLEGYHIYFGSKASALDQVVTVIGATTTSYALANLEPGTWYIAIAAFNNAKVESNLSAVVPVAI